MTDFFVSTSTSFEQAFARYRPLVDDWAAFVDALRRPLPICVWAHPERIAPAELAAILAEEGIHAEPLSWYPGAFRLSVGAEPGRTWAYKVGLFHIQEEVSLLPAVVLSPLPGDRVLDMAAAPGGKTAQMALRMSNRGTVVANDIGPGRMRALRHTLERLGVLNVSTTIANAANLPRRMGAFDRILVDAPCSCEGTVRKNPEVLTTCGIDFSVKHQGLQIALLRKAVHLCRPGGHIVYSTCTFAPEENEAVVDAVIREFGADRLLILPIQLPGFEASPGIRDWNNFHFVRGIENTMRVWPHHHDTGGFFVALLKKSERGWKEVPPDPRLVDSAFNTTVESDSRWLAYLHSRFGIALDTFEPYVFIRRSKRNLYIVNRDHLPPEYPQPDAVGMVFMHTKGRLPKLTTGAALVFGRQATQNVVPLTRVQRDAYLARQTLHLTREQTATCTDPGYVLVTYRGHVLGMGYYRTQPSLVVESNFPKGWMRG